MISSSESNPVVIAGQPRCFIDEFIAAFDSKGDLTPYQKYWLTSNDLQAILTVLSIPYIIDLSAEPSANEKPPVYIIKREQLNVNVVAQIINKAKVSKTTDRIEFIIDLKNSSESCNFWVHCNICIQTDQKATITISDNYRIFEFNQVIDVFRQAILFDAQVDGVSVQNYPGVNVVTDEIYKVLLGGSEHLCGYLALHQLESVPEFWHAKTTKAEELIDDIFSTMLQSQPSSSVVASASSSASTSFSPTIPPDIGKMLFALHHGSSAEVESYYALLLRVSDIIPRIKIALLAAMVVLKPGDKGCGSNRVFIYLSMLSKVKFTENGDEKTLKSLGKDHDFVVVEAISQCIIEQLKNLVNKQDDTSLLDLHFGDTSHKFQELLLDKLDKIAFFYNAWWDDSCVDDCKERLKSICDRNRFLQATKYQFNPDANLWKEAAKAVMVSATIQDYTLQLTGEKLFDQTPYKSDEKNYRLATYIDSCNAVVGDLYPYIVTMLNERVAAGSRLRFNVLDVSFRYAWSPYVVDLLFRHPIATKLHKIRITGQLFRPSIVEGKPVDIVNAIVKPFVAKAKRFGVNIIEFRYPLDGVCPEYGNAGKTYKNDMLLKMKQFIDYVIKPLVKIVQTDYEFTTFLSFMERDVWMDYCLTQGKEVERWRFDYGKEKKHPSPTEERANYSRAILDLNNAIAKNRRAVNKKSLQSGKIEDDRENLRWDPIEILPKSIKDPKYDDIPLHTRVCGPTLEIQQQQVHQQEQQQQHHQQQQQQSHNSYTESYGVISTEGLIGRDAFKDSTSLQRLNTGGRALLELWDDLFGNAAKHKVIIKYITMHAAYEIAQCASYFVDGLNINNLPQGFYLQKTGVGDFVLCFDLSYHSEKKPSKFDLLLRQPELEQELPKDEYYTDSLHGDYLQFIDKIPSEKSSSYSSYGSGESNRSESKFLEFDNKPRSGRGLDATKLLNDFQLLMRGEDPACANSIISSSSKMLNLFFSIGGWRVNTQNIDGLFSIFYNYGCEGIKKFFEMYQSFGNSSDKQKWFLEKLMYRRRYDWSIFLRPDHIAAIDKINNLSPEEYIWWVSLFEQHMQYNKDAYLPDIFNAFEEFCDCLRRRIGGDIKLPLTADGKCPIALKSIPVGLSRLWTILDNASDIREQLDNLDGLNLGQFGAYYASVYEGFNIVTNDMCLRSWGYNEDSIASGKLYKVDHVPTKDEEAARYLACLPDRPKFDAKKRPIALYEKYQADKLKPLAPLPQPKLTMSDQLFIGWKEFAGLYPKLAEAIVISVKGLRFYDQLKYSGDKNMLMDIFARLSPNIIADVDGFSDENAENRAVVLGFIGKVNVILDKIETAFNQTKAVELVRILHDASNINFFGFDGLIQILDAVSKNSTKISGYGLPLGLLKQLLGHKVLLGSKASTDIINNIVKIWKIVIGYEVVEDDAQKEQLLSVGVYSAVYSVDINGLLDVIKLYTADKEVSAAVIEFLAVDYANKEQLEWRVKLLKSLVKYFGESKAAKLDFFRLIGIWSARLEKVAAVNEDVAAVNELVAALVKCEQKLPIITQILFDNCNVYASKKAAEILSIIDRLNAQEPEILEKIFCLCMYEKLDSKTNLFEILQTLDVKLAVNQRIAEIRKEHFAINKHELDRIFSEFTFIDESTAQSESLDQIKASIAFINTIGNQCYLSDDKCPKPMTNLTNAELQELLKKYNSKLQALSRSEDLQYKQLQYVLVAILREVMFRTTGKFPYITQLLPIVQNIIIPGSNISEIATGEGKSIVVALTAAVQCFQGKTVDICTANMELAARDLDDHRKFYEFLGIETALITERSGSKDYKHSALSQSCGVNYSTAAQMALFRSKVTFTGTEAKELHTVGEEISLVIDEVDNLVFDDSTSYVYAIPKESNLLVTRWIYETLNAFIDKQIDTRSAPKVLAEINQAITHLISKANSHSNPQIVAELNRLLQNRKIFVKQVHFWLMAAYSTKKIFDEYIKEQKHFVVQKAKMKYDNGNVEERSVVRIIRGDGRLCGDTKYGRGVHQFLCTRLNTFWYNLNNNLLAMPKFWIDPEADIIASTSAKGFIDYYRNRKGQVYGISGSIGAKIEREEQKSKYSWKFTAIPRNKKPHLTIHNPELCDTSSGFAAKIKSIVLDALNSNRPILISASDVANSEEIYAIVEEIMKTDKLEKVTLQIYNANGTYHTSTFPTTSATAKIPYEQCSDNIVYAQDIIARASQNRCITISTILGRGADIKPDNAKGLVAVQTSFVHQREFRQFSGRAGRGGKPGDAYCIINKTSIAVSSKIILENQRRRLRNEIKNTILEHFIQKFIKIKYATTSSPSASSASTVPNVKLVPVANADFSKVLTKMTKVIDAFIDALGQGEAKRYQNLFKTLNKIFKKKFNTSQIEDEVSDSLFNSLELLEKFLVSYDDTTSIKEKNYNSAGISQYYAQKSQEVDPVIVPYFINHKITASYFKVFKFAQRFAKSHEIVNYELMLNAVLNECTELWKKQGQQALPADVVEAVGIILNSNMYYLFNNRNKNPRDVDNIITGWLWGAIALNPVGSEDMGSKVLASFFTCFDTLIQNEFFGKVSLANETQLFLALIDVFKYNAALLLMKGRLDDAIIRMMFKQVLTRCCKLPVIVNFYKIESLLTVDSELMYKDVLTQLVQDVLTGKAFSGKQLLIYKLLIFLADNIKTTSGTPIIPAAEVQQYIIDAVASYFKGSSDISCASREVFGVIDKLVTNCKGLINSEAMYNQVFSLVLDNPVVIPKMVIFSAKLLDTQMYNNLVDNLISKCSDPMAKTKLLKITLLDLVGKHFDIQDVPKNAEVEATFVNIVKGVILAGCDEANVQLCKQLYNTLKLKIDVNRLLVDAGFNQAHGQSDFEILVFAPDGEKLRQYRAINDICGVSPEALKTSLLEQFKPWFGSLVDAEDVVKAISTLQKIDILLPGEPVLVVTAYENALKSVVQDVLTKKLLPVPEKQLSIYQSLISLAINIEPTSGTPIIPATEARRCIMEAVASYFKGGSDIACTSREVFGVIDTLVTNCKGLINSEAMYDQVFSLVLDNPVVIPEMVIFSAKSLDTQMYNNLVDNLISKCSNSAAKTKILKMKWLSLVGKSNFDGRRIPQDAEIETTFINIVKGLILAGYDEAKVKLYKQLYDMFDLHVDVNRLLVGAGFNQAHGQSDFEILVFAPDGEKLRQYRAINDICGVSPEALKTLLLEQFEQWFGSLVQVEDSNINTQLNAASRILQIVGVSDNEVKDSALDVVLQEYNFRGRLGNDAARSPSDVSSVFKNLLLQRVGEPAQDPRYQKFIQCVRACIDNACTLDQQAVLNFYIGSDRSSRLDLIGLLDALPADFLSNAVDVQNLKHNFNICERYRVVNVLSLIAVIIGCIMIAVPVIAGILPVLAFSAAFIPPLLAPAILFTGFGVQAFVAAKDWLVKHYHSTLSAKMKVFISVLGSVIATGVLLSVIGVLPAISLLLPVLLISAVSLTVIEIGINLLSKPVSQPSLIVGPQHHLAGDKPPYVPPGIGGPVSIQSMSDLAADSKTPLLQEPGFSASPQH